MSETYKGLVNDAFLKKFKSRFLEVIDNAERVESMEIRMQYSRGEAPIIQYQITEFIMPDAEKEINNEQTT